MVIVSFTFILLSILFAHLSFFVLFYSLQEVRRTRSSDPNTLRFLKGKKRDLTLFIFLSLSCLLLLSIFSLFLFLLEGKKKDSRSWTGTFFFLSTCCEPDSKLKLTFLIAHLSFTLSFSFFSLIHCSLLLSSLILSPLLSSLSFFKQLASAIRTRREEEFFLSNYPKVFFH